MKEQIIQFTKEDQDLMIQISNHDTAWGKVLNQIIYNAMIKNNALIDSKPKDDAQVEAIETKEQTTPRESA
jgi:hypothetical protein